MSLLYGINICSVCGFDNGSYKTQDQRSLRPNTKLDSNRYLVGRVLSANGEGFTYTGYDQQRNTRILIKEFYPDTMAYRENHNNNIIVDNEDNFQYKTLKIDFFDLQTNLLNFSDLEGIVPIIKVFEENNTVYSVSQYFETITLEDFLTQIGGSLNYQEAGAIFEPFFETILNLHMNNIIHRGISTETVLIDSGGNLRLSDFGISALRTAKSEITPQLFNGYSAPEQYDMSQWQGTWTDVYSVSSLMYRVITGIKPQRSIDRKNNDNLLPAAKIDGSIPKNISYSLHQGMLVNLEHRTDSIDSLINNMFYGAETLQGGGTRRVDLEQQESSMGYGEAKPKRRKTKKSAIPYTVGSAFITTIILLTLMSFLIKAVDSNQIKVIDETNSSTVEESKSGSEEEPVEYYEIPNFVNSYISRASTDKGANTYFIIKTTTKYDELKPKDIIIEQDVSPGTRINKGDTPIEINLVVSKGRQELPDMKDYPLEDVQKILQEKEIPYETFMAFHDEIEEGRVIRVERGGVLASIIVSKGKEGVKVNSDDPYNEREKDSDGVPLGPLIGDNR